MDPGAPANTATAVRGAMDIQNFILQNQGKGLKGCTATATTVRRDMDTKNFILQNQGKGLKGCTTTATTVRRDMDTNSFILNQGKCFKGYNYNYYSQRGHGHSKFYPKKMKKLEITTMLQLQLLQSEGTWTLKMLT